EVENVTLWKLGRKVEGTLHLQVHHMVFRYHDTPNEMPEKGSQQPTKAKEMWIAYPLISRCTYRPVPISSHFQASIRIQCRDFTYICLQFLTDQEASDVFETMRCLTCKTGSVEKLYAFSYRSVGPEKPVSGWKLYDPRREFKRMGISAKDTDKGWRISEINHDYEYSATYPALIAVPSVISDMTLKYARDFRSRHRIPALSYLHPINNCSITRSSQPLPGIQRKRNPQDEKLIAAIFATSKPNGEIWEDYSTNPSPTDSPKSSTDHLPSESGDSSIVVAGQTAEDEVLANPANLVVEGAPIGRKYGAQQSNLIVDARPLINSLANSAIGKGSEDMGHYKGATKAFLGIANIHVMRNSLNKIVDTLKDSDITGLPPSREQLVKSGWLKHIAGILDGARTIAQKIGIEHSHVLIHCSDGWDRTSQLSALSQILLDPYYRTMEGFIVLVEKEWLSFGHQFRHRNGPLSSEKWFEIEGERIGGDRTSTSSQVSPNSRNALENAIWTAKGLFNNKNDSRESIPDSSTREMGSFDATSNSSPRQPNTPSNPPITNIENKKHATKTDEISPVFHQFLDAVYQLLYQYPTRFEFNERFLKRLLYHLYSCQYGTFLFDSEKERVEMKAAERTNSVWDFFVARKEMFLNKDYDHVVDDNIRGKERLIFPDLRKVRWWAEVFNRKDEEMNEP
ncbi:phosphatases II, partial [Saccharata proteae CBS 121410]